jgi:glycosyltransferase involved in cell wall biosynthesis
MQERKKKKIVIASVLKPVDEVRMYGKIAVSLASRGHKVHVYGRASSQTKPTGTILLHHHSLKSRLSLRRLILPWKLLFKWLAIRPDLLVVCTHELLFVALIYKLLQPVKLIYDVQENYYLNVLHTSAFPKVFRLPLASFIRLKEKLVSPFVNHFILAEAVYVNQLKFTNKACSIIANTVTQPASEHLQLHNTHKWLFSGTLAESTGVYRAIELVKALHQFEPKLQLTICGYAPLISEQLQIRSACAGCDFIILKGIESPVTHSAIVEAIHQSDVGFIYYPPMLHTTGRIATKFYEYSSLGLPILSFQQQAIATMVKAYGLGWILAGTEKAGEIVSILKDKPDRKPLPDHHFWEFTEKELFQVIDSL